MDNYVQRVVDDARFQDAVSLLRKESTDALARCTAKNIRQGMSFNRALWEAWIEVFAL